MEYTVSKDWKQSVGLETVLIPAGDKIEVLDFDEVHQKYFVKFGKHLLVWVHWSTAEKNILDLDSKDFK